MDEVPNGKSVFLFMASDNYEMTAISFEYHFARVDHFDFFLHKLDFT